MCKSGPKNILVQSNYDTSPYCQYLQSHFNICENKTAVMEIGCQFTCEKCKVCGRFQLSVHFFLKIWSEHKLLQKDKAQFKKKNFKRLPNVRSKFEWY